MYTRFVYVSTGAAVVDDTLCYDTPHTELDIIKRFAYSLDDSFRTIMLEWGTENNMQVCMFMIGYMLCAAGCKYIRAQRG